MNKNKGKASQENADREERMDKIRNLISDQSKDAAKVLKVWLTKSLDNSKKNK